uniref:Putative group i salivary lipocalin n=1 Tax=Rhipicephalus pulchellus TaxID=72859 RepID=L7LRC3_RHIPC
MAKQLLVSLLLAAISVMSECKFPSLRRNSWNIRKFVDTSEEIWTFNTSDSKNIICKVDMKQFATVSSLYFNRHYIIRTEKFYTCFNGKFDLQRKECMLVANRESEYLECMVYYHKRFGCAVISVKPQNGEASYYDLRIQSSFIKAGPSPKCVLMFARHAVHGRVIYDPQCPAILRRSRMPSFYTPPMCHDSNRP